MEKGTYVGLKLCPLSERYIEEFIDLWRIPNPIKKEKFHTTVTYSRKELEGFVPRGHLPEPIEAYPIGFDVFKFRTEEGERDCLVLLLSAPEISRRHEQIKQEFGATHDYPSYIPHVSLSYDLAGFPVEGLSPSDVALKLFFEYEYSEELKPYERRRLLCSPDDPLAGAASREGDN